MATKSELVRAWGEQTGRAHPKAPKFRKPRNIDAGVQAAAGEAAVEAAHGPHGKRWKYTLEVSGNGRPSRKSTRKSPNSIKSANQLTRREIRRTRSPKAQARQSLASRR